MKHLTKLILVIVAGLMLAQCSTYKIKPDVNKSGGVNKEAATAVSPDMELAVKKAVLLAKAKLVDRITGEMNNTTMINKEESGTNENLTVAGTSKDTINNVIADTVAKDYVVVKTQILSTKHKSYRAYVLIEMKKKNINDI